MIIVLIGPSGSGKTTIENAISVHGYRKIISYTTRQPRTGERNGEDYYFISQAVFNDLNRLNMLAEYEEYSQGRMYGTFKTDYMEDNKVVVLTPNGYRKILNYVSKDNIFAVYINASLGTRMKRYIDRCGVNSFNFDDKNEICSRVERDYGMFLGLPNEVNLVINNDEGSNIDSIVQEILMSIL